MREFINRDSDRCRLPMSNEDWQFENPLLKIKADGSVESRLNYERVSARPSVRMMSPEHLERSESEPVNETPKAARVQRIKRVAEMYNAGKTYKKMADVMGFNSLGSLTPLVNEAREMGLIDKMRGSPIKTKDNTTTEDEKITVSEFIRQVEVRKKRAQKYQRAAARMEQAAVIAQAVEDLLGDEAEDILARLFLKVTV